MKFRPFLNCRSGLIFIIFIIFAPSIIFAATVIKQQSPPPIVINDIQIYPSAFSATVTWNTDVLSNSTVGYGESSYSYYISNRELKKSHLALLNFRIQPNIKYFFFVENCLNSSSKCVRSNNLSFNAINCGESWRCFNNTNIGYVNASCTWDHDSIKFCESGCANGMCNNHKDNGILYLNSNPRGASVFINGIVKTTTPDVLVNLAPGSYKVKFSKDAYEEFSTEVNVLPGKIVTLKSTLKIKLVCNDTDNGMDSFTKGFAADPFKKFVDKCVNKNTLNESICDGKTSLAETKIIKCDNGCSKGKCKKATNTNTQTKSTSPASLGLIPLIVIALIFLFLFIKKVKKGKLNFKKIKLKKKGRI
ncbi:PEGA domain-containing protein [Candidatus Woesearchaeota archaeon]|nr:PEGA domain-containing protein [Candidatus Woesearchaeota archaeon]